MAGEIEIKLKGLREVRQELKVLQFELSQATDPEQMAQLSQKAGELRDNLARANEQASVFAAGSPFEQTNNALGLMSSQIMSLDFDGAAESAKLFATAAKGINGGQIATQLKGLGSVVVSVGKAFTSMGLALLTNPIFLIAAAIVGIVTVIGVLLNKLGLLKPILDAVGAAFKVVKDVIMTVVQALKDFLDWLGLTSFAAEEAAEKQAAAQEKIAASYEDKRKKLTTAYDQEIALAKIAGEDTVEMERKKQNAIIETSRQQYKALEAQKEALKAAGTLTAEQSKQINETMRSLKDGIAEARFEIKKINAQEVADNNKKNEDVEKADQESYKKRVEAAKKYGEERLAAQRLIRDLEIELMEEGEAKDLAANQEKYARLIEDTKKNEKLLASEKATIIADYKELQFEAEKAIQQKQDDELKLAVETASANRIAAKKVESDEFLNRTKEENAKLLEQQKAFNEAQVAADQTLFNAKFDAAKSLVSSLGSLAGENKKIANAIFAVDKALAIAEIIVSTQREIAGYASNPTWSLLPDGGAAIKAGYIAAAKVRAGVGIATIAAASIAKFMNGGGSGGSGGGGSFGGGSSTSAAVPSATPQVNLFGQNNNANNLSASQSNDQSITVTAVVSETEITETQNKVKGIKEMSSL